MSTCSQSNLLDSAPHIKTLNLQSMASAFVLLHMAHPHPKIQLQKPKLQLLPLFTHSRKNKSDSYEVLKTELYSNEKFEEL